MVILLSNGRAGVRRRGEDGRNAHGERVPGALAVGPVAVMDAYLEERSDGTWLLGLDPAMWPVRQGDQIVTDGGLAFVAQTTDLHTNSEDPTVDYVEVSALRLQDDGTRPPDTYYSGR